MIQKTFKFLILFFFISNFLILLISFFADCKSEKILKKYDAIIVLGCPTNLNCSPSTIMKTRVDKAIQLYQNNLSRHLIFTGSAVHNDCSEAFTMMQYAIEKGINKENITLENKATNTYQNALFSVEIMDENGYTTAAVISSAPHIQRACYAFSKFNKQYTMFPATYPEDTSILQKIFWIMGEKLFLSHHLIFGIPKNYNAIREE